MLKAQVGCYNRLERLKSCVGSPPLMAHTQLGPAFKHTLKRASPWLQHFLNFRTRIAWYTSNVSSPHSALPL